MSRTRPWFPHEGRVPHISLVFREMWDTTASSLCTLGSPDDVEGKLSIGSSPLQALVVLTEEGLQIAHECSQALIGIIWRFPSSEALR